LIAFCKERLAGYKCPRIVTFVPTLPKSPIDKIVRKEVREEYWTGHKRRVQ
jgi:acyl-CoA synthetase (AMP-forming)/AMP-acid ligase II